jgi:ABC-2 type transport system ATP-binding protein
VCKSFGEHAVLDQVDLEVAEGTIFSLLGPNGAGKTTMVRILSTLITADAGAVRVAGHDVATDPDGVRAAIGVTGQFSAVDNLLTGEENLRLMADLRHLGRDAGRRRVAELLERFELTDAARKLLSTYSGGMRRRLDLAMTLVGEPRVLFLDEPTTGLDPRSRRTMWQIIGELLASGVTILLTTQYLEEADRLADRIAVLDHGRIVAEGTSAELKRRIPGGHVQLEFADPNALGSAVDLLPTSSHDLEQLTLQVPGDGSVTTLRLLLNQLADAGIEVDDLSIHTPDLDDVFFAVTGRPTESVREEAFQP